MSIHQPTSDFDFSKIHLAHPVPLHNGVFFTQINHTAADEPLYIYTPKCTTKNGVVTAGAKTYLDLVFTAANTNLMEWIHALEERLQTLIYEKRDRWFAESIELDDIQSVFMPVFKVNKGSHYIMRAYTQNGKKLAAPIQVYNEHETPRTIADIKPDSELITILDVQGVKFSQKSFCVSLVLKQIMVFEHSPVFNQCLIKQSTIKDVEVDIDLLEDPIVLRKPVDVYGEMYKGALEKARRAQAEAEETMKAAEDIKRTHGIVDEI